MTGIKEVYEPNPDHVVYQELYRLYRQMHDAFGTTEWSGTMFNVMKDLLVLREKQRKHGPDAYYGQKKKGDKK